MGLGPDLCTGFWDRHPQRNFFLQISSNKYKNSVFLYMKTKGLYPLKFVFLFISLGSEHLRQELKMIP